MPGLTRFSVRNFSGPQCRLGGMRRRLGLPLLSVSLTLLGAAWSMSTQPFKAPDESSHYLRALTITEGHLVGRQVPYPQPQGFSAVALAWLNANTRATQVPPALSPPYIACTNGRADAGRSPCAEATEAGDYQPLPYLLPAAALHAAGTANTGLWLSRFASLAPCLAFLILALALLWTGTLWSVLGVQAALTPMVLFVSSVINPNGLEVASSLALACAGLRIARAPTQVPNWVWVSFAASGITAILSWQLGPAFVIADLVLGLALLGSTGVRQLKQAAKRQLGLSCAALGFSLLVYVIYDLAANASHINVGIHPIRQSLNEGLAQISPVLRDSVGTFGALSIHLPTIVCWLWWLLVAAMIVAALRVGCGRHRSILAVVVLLAFAFPVLFYAWAYRLTGWPGLQGRYVLPIMMLIPLVAGELNYLSIGCRVRGRPGSWLSPATSASLAVIQGYAWWLNARANAGMPGTIRFYAHALWTPPLGWILWVAVAALGTLGLLLFAVCQAGSFRPLGQPVLLEQPQHDSHYASTDYERTSRI